MRFETYTIPALDDTIRGFFAIFCPLRSRINPIFLTLVTNYRTFATNQAPDPNRSRGLLARIGNSPREQRVSQRRARTAKIPARGEGFIPGTADAPASRKVFFLQGK